MISLRLTASSEESHHCGCWPLRWLTQTLSITTSLYLAAVFSASYWFRLKTPTNKHSLLLQYDQPALSWVYSAEARYPASPPSPSRPHHGGGGGRTDGRTDGLGAHENSVNTSMNNLPRNRTPSPTPPHVSSHQDPRWTVLACQCSLQNAKPARRLHEVDKLAEWTEMKTQLTAKEKIN